MVKYNMRKQQYKSIVIYFVGNRFDYAVTLESAIEEQLQQITDAWIVKKD